jgi:hypothetical protein
MAWGNTMAETDLLLLKSQKNEVFVLVKAVGFDPIEFELEEFEEDEDDFPNETVNLNFHRLAIVSPGS